MRGNPNELADDAPFHRPARTTTLYNCQKIITLQKAAALPRIEAASFWGVMEWQGGRSERRTVARSLLASSGLLLQTISDTNLPTKRTTADKKDDLAVHIATDPHNTIRTTQSVPRKS